VTTKADKPLISILWLLLIIGLAFALYAVYVFVVEIYLGPPGGELSPGAAARNKIISGIADCMNSNLETGFIRMFYHVK
jgi:hypothetical protein